MTFSLAILCKTLGVPYIAPKHELIELTYNPASSKIVTADISAVIEKFFSRASRVTVAARVIINMKYRNVLKQQPKVTEDYITYNILCKMY